MKKKKNLITSGVQTSELLKTPERPRDDIFRPVKNVEVSKAFHEEQTHNRHPTHYRIRKM